MAETLLSFGVEKVWDLLVRESERFQGVEEQFNELQSNMSFLKSFLKDADSKKHAIEMVKNSVEEIKDIVLDIEDIIETFVLKDELSQRSGIKKHVRKFSWIIVVRRKLSLDMEAINKRIFKVIRDMQTIGVISKSIVEGGKYSNPLQEIQEEIRKTFPSNNENDLVGLEENVKKLVGYLVEEDSSQVVSITGMGGIGKTTLARQVFNHEMVRNHFDGFAWVCISQNFTRKYVWKTILQKLSLRNDEQKISNMSEDELQKKLLRFSKMTEDELQEKLYQLLKTTNSLIVLDDMWKEEDWDRIKDVFPSKKGWKVILTSRNEKVAIRADPTCVPTKPECLTSEESWTLFQKIVFPFSKDTTEHKVDVEMENIGKQMIKHCGGLPLAIKVLGGLLARKHTLSEWKMVCENIGSHLAERNIFSDGNHISLHHLLSLSFEELPISLKHCFLYLAHFPEDHIISIEKLSYYWAAEGIIKCGYNERASIRDVADFYIDELVMRNMVIAKRDMLTSRFATCHLHDVMRDFCLSKANEENFLHTVHGTSTADSKSRRLVIHLPAETFNVKGEIKNPKLRSLLLMSKQFSWTTWMASDLCFKRLQLMRVLDLSFAKFERGKLPSSIGKLIHLRYLSLFQTKVFYLPSSMRNLKKLLYLNLDVGLTYPMLMSNFWEEMQELEYLHLPETIYKSEETKLGSLVNLKTLKNFSTNNCSLEDLHRMTRLKTVTIIFNGGCTMETLSSSLSGLDGVDIKHLEINTILPNLPDQKHFLPSLTTIHLKLCFLTEDPMPILEKLPELKEVVLWPLSFSGRRMICSGSGFPKLLDLHFSALDEWDEWIIEEGSMPLLQNLSIWNPPKLKQLPDGLRFITSLKELEIYTDDLDMKKEWNKRLSEEGEDYYKVKHIPSLIF